MKCSSVRALSLLLTALTVMSASACQKSVSDTDWRAEVTDVLSARTTTQKAASVLTPSATAPVTDQTPDSSGAFVIPEGYVAGQPHPLDNPEAGEIPSISYGQDLLLYGDYLYYPAHYYGGYNAILSYTKLSELQTADFDPSSERQPTPQPTPVCNNPFCGHKPYNINNGVYCPLYFGVHRGDPNAPLTPGAPINWSQTYYCIDYSQSNGSMPVFYICAAEPEYTVVGEQVIETESNDAAVYRYDVATGKRTIIAENLPDSIYFFALSGEYIYFSSSEGLTAINKNGNQVGKFNSDDHLFHILEVADDTLFICDESGGLYTSDRMLSKVEKVFSYHFDLSELSSGYAASQMGDYNYVPPYGYTVSDGYLYFCADYVCEFKDEYREIYSASLYRIPLGDPGGTHELLAEKVNSNDLIGVHDSIAYYVPYKDIDDRAHKLNCIDVGTKEIRNLYSNGFDEVYVSKTTRSCPIVNENFIAGYSYEYLNGGILLYDLKSGDYLYMSYNYDW